MSFEQVIGELNQFLTGWVTYFGHAECKSLLREMDSWVRRKLRCLTSASSETVNFWRAFFDLMRYKVSHD